MLPFVALAVGGGLLYREHLEEARLYREQQAVEAVQAADRARLFARGEFAPVFEICREGWRNEFSIYNLPSALAWTRTRLDGYFLEGIDLESWRQMRCDANGVRRGPRVERPMLEQLPAEASPGLAAATVENWDLALVNLAQSPLGPGILGIELLSRPLTGEVIRRRWSGVEGGAKATVEPAGAPVFPGLIAEPPFAMAPGAAPPGLRALRKRHWGKEGTAAFAALEKVIPAGAGISEMDLDEDGISVRIEASTPAFDGDPPMPYGDLDLDEYGIPESDWWYPRPDPGFGCLKGRPLAEVRADYENDGAAALAWRAWYSCSPAYSDGKKGSWHFFTE